jgi:beta-lactamase class A
VKKPALVIFLILAILSSLIIFRNGPVATTKAEDQQVILPSIDEPSLSSTINAILAETDLDTGVAITDLQTHKTYTYGEPASYIAASTTKLLTASLFLHQVELGKASMNDKIDGLPAAQQLKALIVDSDNSAWTGFNDELTRSGLAAYAKSLGLNTYKVADNTITVKDVASLLTQLYNKELLNKEHTDLLLSYMQNASEDQYIPAVVPASATVYHKAGWLEDRMHDTAIIKDGDRSYVLVIFSKDMSGSYSVDEGLNVFHAITKATVATFFPKP